MIKSAPKKTGLLMINGLSMWPSHLFGAPGGKPTKSRVVPCQEQSVILSPDAQGEGQQEEHNPGADENLRGSARKHAASVLAQFHSFTALLIGRESKAQKLRLSVDQLVFAAAPMADRFLRRSNPRPGLQHQDDA